jgi:predicted AlkP superfamily phosphohydrolase/phosphomutase
MSQPRLVLIGIDAASSALVRKWAAAGDLPTIAGLLRSGFSAPIATPLGVLEGGIWPSFLTSSSPASHGMFSHLKLKPRTYDLEVGMYANRLPVPPFWAHLSGAGKRVAVIDAPFARPVSRLNGIQVTNWGAHDPWCWRRSSWPPRLIGELVRRFGSHPVDTCDAEGRSLEDYEDLRVRLIAGVKKKTALLRHCLAREPWDFFFGVFSESHCAGHQFWHLMDQRHPQHDRKASEALCSTIRDVYRAIDAGVGTILGDVEPGTHVLLMLSHGMGPYYAGSHLLDLVIERLGLNGNCAAAPASRAGEATTGVSRTGRLLWMLRYLLPYKLRLELRSRLPKTVVTLRRWFSRPDSNPWCRSRAFAVPSNNMTGAIRINLKGREPEGLVEPGVEYEALRQELIDALLALENPETGRSAVQWVARVEDLYQGTRLRDMPDLLVEWDHSAPINMLCSPRIGRVSQAFGGDRTGDHWQNGLLIGRGFRSGEIAEKICTEDIAPTILDFFDVLKPATYEGRSALSFLQKAKAVG